jgi:replication factor C subunit 2/4
MLRFNNLLEVDNDTTDTKYIEKKNIKQRIPWVDKYRPKKLDDIIQQDEVVKFLKESLKTGNMPHLLFHGPPGSGKTTSILAIVSELYGPIKVHERVIELNASDECGINVVRHKIITFAETKISNPDPNYPCPPFKIIILDEADAMTTEAQSALRKVMEDLSKITRFCFICNYINQIIDPISSRCMKFRFKSLNKESINDKLAYISKNENMNISNEVINTISSISKGDVRRSIMILQNLKYIYDYKNKVDINDVYEITNTVPKNEIDNIWNIINTKSNNVLDFTNLTNKLQELGYPFDNILEQLKNKIIISEISDIKKSLIGIQLGITERKLLEGSDEYIQLLNLLCYINGVIFDIITHCPTIIC